MDGVPHRQRPCDECPFRKDTEPGQFPAERYDALRDTAGGKDGMEGLRAPMFGCHKSPEGGEIACAGWLAVCGYDHLGIRLAVIQKRLPVEAFHPREDWPELHESYEAMAEAMGA